MISIIIPTYNRSRCIARALDSVLAQDYRDWEIVLVDDGSTDATASVLQRYADPRIRMFKHPFNRGVGAAKNTGLDQIRGEWFGILDSDDELAPDALAELMRAAGAGPGISAVTCNCIDSETGSFTGRGFEGDLLLEPGQIYRQGRGEFWGITKTELLQGRRLNENVVGWEDILWFGVEKKALRYYLHRGLRVYHTGHGDRLSKIHVGSWADIERNFRNHTALLGEEEFLSCLRSWRPEQYLGIVFSAGLLLIERGERGRAFECARRLATCSGGLLKGLLILLGVVAGPGSLTRLKQLKGLVKR